MAAASTAGIETALRAILVSPNFLFRVERNPRGSARRAQSIESATWSWRRASRSSSGAAFRTKNCCDWPSKDKLRPVLNQQVQPHARRPEVQGAGGQLRRPVAASAQRRRLEARIRTSIQQFDDPLRSALQRETELFFEHIVREDRSVLDFLDADYTFLNERLARHYGIPGVRGSYFRRVAVNGDERGGILTQGSVLTVTSYPTRTSPVLRGKWILENVLGAPPPPPPPDVPALAESASSLGPGPARAAGKASRQRRVRFLPLRGSIRWDLRWRTTTPSASSGPAKAGREIDASGSLPSGITVSGPGDLKKVLLERRDEFVECLAEKLLTYALGRGLEHYDLPAVRQIRARGRAQRLPVFIAGSGNRQ